MNNLIIIDDATCKDELKSFIAANADQIKLFLTEDDYNIDLDVLIQRIHSVFDDQKMVFIRTEDSLIKIAIADVFYINENESGVFLNLVDGTVYQLPEELEHYIKSFANYNIIQINDKVLVNTSFIESYIINQGILFFDGGLKFEVASNFENKLLNHLNNIDKLK